MPPRRSNLSRRRRTPTHAERREARLHRMRLEIDRLPIRTLLRYQDMYDQQREGRRFYAPADEDQARIVEETLADHYRNMDERLYGTNYNIRRYADDRIRPEPRPLHTINYYEHQLNRFGASRAYDRYRNRTASVDPAVVVVAAAVEQERPRPRNPRRQREEQLMLEWEAERPPHPHLFIGDDRGPPVIEEVDAPAPPVAVAAQVPIAELIHEAVPTLMQYVLTGNYNAFSVLCTNLGVGPVVDQLWDEFSEMHAGGEGAPGGSIDPI